MRFFSAQEQWKNVGVVAIDDNTTAKDQNAFATLCILSSITPKIDRDVATIAHSSKGGTNIIQVGPVCIEAVILQLRPNPRSKHPWE